MSGQAEAGPVVWQGTLGEAADALRRAVLAELMQDLGEEAEDAAPAPSPLGWAEGWIDPPTPRGTALRERLSALEGRVLAGAASQAERDEFVRLQASHAAWLNVWAHARQVLARELGGEDAAERVLDTLTRAGIALTCEGEDLDFLPLLKAGVSSEVFDE